MYNESGKEIVTRKRLMYLTWEKLNKKYTQRMISEILCAFYEVLLDVIYEGAKIYIHDVCSIYAKWMKPRKNYNPIINEYETIPGHFSLRINALQYMREMLEQMTSERAEEIEE